MADLRSPWQSIDFDSGGGTDLIAVHGLVAPASGGAVVIPGTVANGLLVDVSRVTGTVTVDTEMSAAAALTDNFANPTVPGVAAFGMFWDGSAWDRAPGTSTGGLSVTVQNASVTVDTELVAPAALADATANPTVTSVGVLNMGFNGTTWDRLRTANTGRLQVDVITGGGVDTPTTPTTDYVTSASLAAGSEVNLDTAEAAGMKLRRVDVWTSVAYRARVFLVNNGSEAAEPIAVGGGQPFQAWSYSTPHRNYAALGTTAGADTFRVEVTNLDDANAADCHATFAYEA